MPALSLASLPDAPRSLVVDAEPDTNCLLRVLEPFVIHDVVPARVEVRRLQIEGDSVLRIIVQFDAVAELADRLAARIGTLVTVRAARLADVDAAREAA